MSERKTFSTYDEGYFGISLLNIGSYGAHLMNNTIKGGEQRNNHLYFTDVHSEYFGKERALTIEGVATGIATPSFAIASLEAYGRIARDMDELAKPFAS